MNIVFRHKERIPVKTYGGTERILWWLMKELVELGHEVSLIGDPGSELQQIGAKLIPDTRSSDWQDLIPKNTDIVHLTLMSDVEAVKDHPTILTIHGNGKLNERFQKNTVFLSKKHAFNHNATCYVYNGIDFSEYPFQPKSTNNKNWQNFCFLAKANWSVKNLKDCIKVCKTAKKNLTVAGGRAYSLSKYIKSLGFIDNNKKLELLRSSNALLFPVRWHEPFGVAIIEAYTQGLPVIGSNYGSLPELINKDTGVLCNNYAELLEAVSKEENVFDAERIRVYAESKFNSKDMAKSYLKLYAEVIEGKNLNETYPEYSLKQDPESLLPFGE